MSILRVTTCDGLSKNMPGRAGLSITEILRDNGVDEVLAMCDGRCSCATCHVYVDKDQFASLTLMSDDENDLLESLNERQGNSRLAYQVPWSNDLDELHATIASGKLMQ